MWKSAPKPTSASPFSLSLIIIFSSSFKETFCVLGSRVILLARSLVGECVAIYSDDAPGMLMMMTTIVSCF